MIETMRDLKHHSKSGSHEKLTLERTASQILHHMEDKDSEDSLESTRARVLCEQLHPITLPTPSIMLPSTLLILYISERPSNLRRESSARRDKFCPDFLKKDRSRHRRTQSDE